MTTSNLIYLLTLSTVQQVSLTRQSEGDICAMVTNDGDGKTCGVTLTETLTTCSCKDAMYRDGICKHTVATALHVLRTAPAMENSTNKPASDIHLMWREGTLLCGISQPA